MSDTDISNFLYHESLRIEPRGCKQPPKFVSILFLSLGKLLQYIRVIIQVLYLINNTI